MNEFTDASPARAKALSKLFRNDFRGIKVTGFKVDLEEFRNLMRLESG